MFHHLELEKVILSAKAFEDLSQAIDDSNPGKGQIVNLLPKLVITRSFAIVLNDNNPDAKKFIRYLHANEALKSFYAYDWYTSR